MDDNPIEKQERLTMRYKAIFNIFIKNFNQILHIMRIFLFRF